LTYTDKTLVCGDCGAEFIHSADDQEFFAMKGYTEPKRCPSCRQARKAERGGGGGGGGGGGYGGPREMHQITCSNCGKTDEVPFLPRGDRPVYCSDCFSQQRSRAY
jgi:CxxC-x17-CxxC domain-containing protein